jgi:hypothetical protein
MSFVMLGARREGPRAGAPAGMAAGARGGLGRGRTLLRARRPGPRASTAGGGSSGGLGQGRALWQMEPRARSIIGGRNGGERNVREDKVKRERGK